MMRMSSGRERRGNDFVEVVAVSKSGLLVSVGS